MNVEEAVRKILADDADVAALVGTRVLCGILPQDPTYPALTIQPIVEDANTAVNDAKGLEYARLQVDAWATSYGGAKALIDAVKAALHGQTFSETGCRIGSAVALTGGGYMYEDSVKVHRRFRDFGLWYAET
jgi:hypothetical protein